MTDINKPTALRLLAWAKRKRYICGRGYTSAVARLRKCRSVRAYFGQLLPTEQSWLPFWLRHATTSEVDKRFLDHLNRRLFVLDAHKVTARETERVMRIAKQLFPPRKPPRKHTRKKREVEGRKS